MIFRLVIFCLPHASYAYENYWLCDRCDRYFMLKKNQLPSMTSKRIDHLIKLLMLIGVSIQQRISLQRYHRLLLWIFYVYSVLRLLCLCARLFICAFWSPAGKGLTSWLSFVVSNCEFVTFPLVFWARCGT